MIGMAPNLPWILCHMITGKDGRYVITKGKVNSQEFTITGVYVPHKQQSPFWEKFLGQLLQIRGKEFVTKLTDLKYRQY